MATVNEESVSRSDQARFLQAERCARHMERGGRVRIGGMIEARLNIKLHLEFGLREILCQRAGYKTKKGAVSADGLRIYLQTAGPIQLLA